MSERVNSLQEVINAAVSNARRSLYTCAPAKVVKWEPSTQRANCQILVKHVDEDEEGNRTVASWPVVPGVPVQFLGAGGFRITCPISAGGGGTEPTTGLLIWSHLSMDKWLTGNGAEVDPEFDHDHALGDAVFLPGLVPFGAAWQSMPTNQMTVGADSGVQVHITSSLITLGDESSAQFVALANKVKAWFDAFNTAVTGWTPVPNDGGAALKTALATLIGGTPTTDVSATQAKAT